MRNVPVNIPLIDESDVAAVSSALRDGWVSGDGPVVGQFEESFAAFCDRKHGISVTNGTAAIEIVIHALQIGPGDEVILPSFAIISCVSQILRAGATPIFVDADPDTWNMNSASINEKISSRTKAILVVHTYGLPSDLDPIIDLAEKNNIPIIEDAAESHGLIYKGKRCGSFGLVSTFSFYANKNITTGEGGMVVTNDDVLAARIRYFRNLTFEADRRFVHHDLGWNLRMSSLQCALGSSQLGRIESILASRRRLGGLYQEAFSGIPGIQLPCLKTDYATNDYWVFGIVLKDGGLERREIVQNRLAESGVGTRPFFWPLHKQPVLEKFGLDEQPNLPVSEYLGRSGFYIPNGLGQSEADTEHVINHVSKILRGL